MEKNVGQRLLVIAISIAIAFVLLWPPQQKLRPGLDIAGGTSLIFEIDATGAEQYANLAEDVKTLLQRRVDPQGVYNLTWRVHGRNRLEVQMPLPPKNAAQRRQAYAQALEQLYACELKRGPIEAALRLQGEERAAAVARLARGRADLALAAVGGDDGRRAAIERVVAERQALLEAAAKRYDALQAAEAARQQGPVEPQPDSRPDGEEQSASAPATQAISQGSLNQAWRDASELFEDAIQEVLATNLNRRRFEEILELEAKSAVRQKSLAQILDRHADLRDLMEDVIAKHAAWRSGKQFLDGPADLKRLLRGAGKLEFRILAEPDPGNPTKYDSYRKQLQEGRPRPPGEFGWFKVDNPMQFFDFGSPAELEAFRPETHPRFVVEKFDNNYWVLAKVSPQDGLLQDLTTRKWRLTGARPGRDEHGRPSVEFQLDTIGGMLFENLTRANIEKPLCILVDDVAYSAPSIRSAIRTQGQITGEFSPEKVRYLVQTMQGGTLPARLKDTPLSERTVGSSLGEANRDAAVRAGLIGACAVALIMVGYYWLCGLIANLAMALNVMLTLAAMAMLGARITLDGIAGIILAIGMSVDANVLIYERMREEKERGGSLRMVIKNGYDKALSTIFDSNITTLLTCVIIYYVGSEEVKGFGLTLGWGVALNLYTAVFVTRTLFGLLLKYNLIRDIKMLKLIRVPNIDWYSKSKYLIPLSAVAILSGVSVLYLRGASNLFDIEFLGGVAAEFELKQAGLNDRTIGDRLQRVGLSIADDARRLEQASLEPVPGQADAFLLRVPGVDVARLEAMLTEPLESENLLQRGGMSAAGARDHLTVYTQGEVSADQLLQKIRSLAAPLSEAGKKLAGANVSAVLEVAGVAQQGLVWNVTTTVTNMRLVEHAITSALGDDMRVQPSITHLLRSQGNRPYPITSRLLDNVVPGLPPGVNADLTDYLGGAAIYLDQLDPPQSVEGLRARLDNMHFQPDFQDQPKRDFTVIGVSPAGDRLDESGNPLYSAVVVATVDPDLRYSDNPESWYANFAQPELNLIQTALSTKQTLRKVMQFKPQIAARSTQQAIAALLLSWGMIIGYVWIRFGRVTYGMGGVVALIHDVLVALAFVGFSGWLAAQPFGRALLIEDFKINMPIVAALLTIIGFSINDTIVIFDRIREIRGRLGIVTPKIINDSINECMSRTILTTVTVLVVIFIAYVWGGSSIRGFNYCMLLGCISGTYSTIVIAAPLLLVRLKGWGAPAAVPAAR